jgi:hypothetical protein
MEKSSDEIIREIKDHIDKCGGPYSSWYVGISSDAKKRLRDEHNVTNEAYIYRTAASAEDARQIERYLIETLCTDGGPGGGDATTNMVYAYKKSPSTNP